MKIVKLYNDNRAKDILPEECVILFSEDYNMILPLVTYDTYYLDGRELDHSFITKEDGRAFIIKEKHGSHPF